MSDPFRLAFTAAPEDIDELGHVNNAVWVRWMERIATAHWEAIAPAAHRAAWVWVVTRHEIDYRGNIAAGEEAVAETFIPDPPRGARFDRRVDFRDGSGKLLVSARSSWALIDRATGRLSRIPAEVAGPFMVQLRHSREGGNPGRPGPLLPTGFPPSRE